MIAKDYFHMMDEDCPKVTRLELAVPDGENRAISDGKKHLRKENSRLMIMPQQKWPQQRTSAQNKTRALPLPTESNFFMDISTREGMVLRLFWR